MADTTFKTVLPALKAIDNGDGTYSISVGGTIAGLANATTPTKYLIDMVVANTEYSQALPANTLKFCIHLRDMSSFRLAWVTGKVAGPVEPYETVSGEKSVDGLDLSSKTVYVASANAAMKGELEVWT